MFCAFLSSVQQAVSMLLYISIIQIIFQSQAQSLIRYCSAMTPSTSTGQDSTLLYCRLYGPGCT